MVMNHWASRLMLAPFRWRHLLSVVVSVVSADGNLVCSLIRLSAKWLGLEPKCTRGSVVSSSCCPRPSALSCFIRMPDMGQWFAMPWGCSLCSSSLCRLSWRSTRALSVFGLERTGTLTLISGIAQVHYTHSLLKSAQERKCA